MWQISTVYVGISSSAWHHPCIELTHSTAQDKIHNEQYHMQCRASYNIRLTSRGVESSTRRCNTSPGSNTTLPG